MSGKLHLDVFSWPPVEAFEKGNTIALSLYVIYMTNSMHLSSVVYWSTIFLSLLNYFEIIYLKWHSYQRDLKGSVKEVYGFRNFRHGFNKEQ